MEKLIALVALFAVGCGPLPENVDGGTDAGQVEMFYSVDEVSIDEADDCCSCLDEHTCRADFGGPFSANCRESLRNNYRPRFVVESCVAGEPWDTPRGLCAAECPWL